MKILYASLLDPKKNISWSGLTKNIYECLKKTNHQVISTGPLISKFRYIFIIIRIILSFFNLTYDADRKIFLSKIYAYKIKKFLKKDKYDLIITSDTYLVSYLETDIPIIIWTDLNYATWINTYFGKNNILLKSYLEANELEKLAIKRSKKILLTSEWAINQSRMYYGYSNKYKKLVFGSNLKYKFTRKLLIKNIKKKIKSNICKLISIGVDWDRKGMQKSLKIVDYMNKNGCKSKLTIVGSYRKISNKNVSFKKFLDKENPNHLKKFIKLLKESHFHILMTKAEGFGVAFLEASSFGVYNISNNIGGVPGAINNNVNGKLFSKNENYKIIGNYLIKLFNSKRIFKQKSILSFKHYNKYKSWEKISVKLNKIILKIINFQ